jgi:hypothetical protein
MNFFCLQTQGLYPEVRIDVEVSSGEDDALKSNASAGKQKKSADDDMREYLQLSRSLLTRSVLTCRDNPILLSLLGLLPPCFPLASAGLNTLCQLLGATGRWIR